MLHILVPLVGLALAVLAILVMVRAVSVQEIFSFSRKGMVALVVFLVAGCYLEHAVVTLLPVAAKALLFIALVVAIYFLLIFLASRFSSRGENRQI